MTNLVHRAYNILRDEGIRSLTTEARKFGIRRALENDLISHALYLMRRTREYGSFPPPYLITDNTIEIYKYSDLPTYFGYHDVSPFGPDGNTLLATAIRDDHLIVGSFNIPNDEFTPLDETDLWSWQQGCRLQWHKSRNVIYNKRVCGKNGAVIRNVDTGQIVQELTYPIYSIAENGEFALTFDFERLGALRDGYGWNNKSIETQAPSTEGIWKVDLATGSRELIISLRRVSEFNPTPSMKDATHWVNHVFINPSSDYFVFLHRWKDKDNQRHTRLLSNGCEGEELQVLESQGGSHMAWKNEREVLATIGYDGGYRYKLYTVDGCEESHVHKMIKLNGHPQYSSRGALVTDLPPGRLGERKLITIEDENVSEVARFYNYEIDSRRCDLHPRWDRDGKRICVDTMHRGQRCMAVVEVGE